MVRNSSASVSLGLLFAFAGLAGCVSDGGGTESRLRAGPPTSAEFSGDSGGIEGLVLDTENLPVDGAQVGLSPVEALTVTDAEGRFAFSELEPGAYTLFAQRLGFESVAKRVDVVAGQATRVELELRALAVKDPFSLLLQQDGLFGCGVRIDPVVGVAVCGVLSIYLNLTQYDKFLLEWELPHETQDWQTGVFETTWESNQALGRGLRIYWEVLGCSNDSEFRFDRTDGVDPIRARVENDRLQEIIANREDHADDCGDAADNCNPAHCLIQSRAFSSANTTGQSVDVGFTFQQRYTQYLSAFYAEPAPADFTAIVDR